MDAYGQKQGWRVRGWLYAFLLACAAIQAHWDGYKPLLDELFSPAVPPLERLTGYFDKVYAFQKEHKESSGFVCGCPYFDLGTEISSLDSAIVARVTGVLDRYFRYFLSAVSEARARDLIKVRSSEASARWLMHYFEGALMNARIHNDPELLSDLSTGAMHLLGVRDGNV